MKKGLFSAFFCFLVIMVGCTENPEFPPESVMGPGTEKEEEEEKEGTTVLYEPRPDHPREGIYFSFDLKRFKRNGLAKKSINSSSLARYRLSKCDSVYFRIEDSSGQSQTNGFAIIGDSCSGWIMVPPGKEYYILATLRGQTICPWDSSWSIVHNPFYAEDTVDLNNSLFDTLELVFRERFDMAFFVKIEVPDPENYEEGGEYDMKDNHLGIRAVYREGNLHYWARLHDVRKNVVHLDVRGQTLSFVVDIMSVIDDDIVEVKGSWVAIGKLFFDFNFPLKTVDASYENDVVMINFNKKNLEIYPDSADIAILDSSGTDIFPEGDCMRNIGFIQWIRSGYEPLPSGDYEIIISGARDYYDVEMAGIDTLELVVP